MGGVVLVGATVFGVVWVQQEMVVWFDWGGTRVGVAACDGGMRFAFPPYRFLSVGMSIRAPRQQGKC